jgi:hypothetical protein
MITLKNLHRRTFLRGMLQGSAVVVALPLLDVLLDPHGEALAKPGPDVSAKGGSSDGLPLVFGTWYWPLGLQLGLWAPQEVAAKAAAAMDPSKLFRGVRTVDNKVVPVYYTTNDELAPLAPIMGKFNIFSGTQVLMDGKTIIVHYSSVQAQYTGTISTGETPDTYGRSLDQDIAAFFGTAGVVFPSITVTGDGVSRATWSSPGPSTGMNPPEVSPLALYTKMFGPSYVDPNAATFHPNPSVMVRDSVLSGVADDRQRLMRILPATDRARLDAYFSSLRDLEHQLHAELQKPKPLLACTKPAAPRDQVGSDIKDVQQTSHLFAQLQAHAFSCGLTRVWNTSLTIQQPPVHVAGDPVGNHEHTHEDPVDAKLQYQPKVKWFADQYMGMLTDLVQTLDSIKEGKGTLLDRALIMGVTDHGCARQHSVTQMPLFTAGFANGRVRNGLHVPAPGDTVCRLGLTCQQAVGMPVGSWGTESNNTSKPFSEILV